MAKVVKTSGGEMIDYSEEVLEGVTRGTLIALESIGMKIEKYAKALCPVGTPESTGIRGYRGGTLRRSISYSVDAANKQVIAGTNVEYAPYVELGTGPYFQVPPEWEQFGTKKGSGIGANYVKARPYLRPAVEDHLTEYAKIIKDCLSD